MTASAPKPGPSPSTGAVSRRLAAAGFDVAVSVGGSYLHDRAREGARTSGGRREGDSVSVHWSTAFTDARGYDSDYHKHNAPRYAAAYAAYLADFYEVLISPGGSYIKLTQKADAPKVAKGAPRVKDVVTTLKAAGLRTHVSPKIHYAPLGSLVFQRLDCAEVATTAHDDLTHEAATQRTRAALEADGWTVDQYDRVDTIILRVTARAATPERTEATVPADTAPADLAKAADVPPLPASAPVEGVIAPRPGEGSSTERADHPVIRSVVVDLIAAGHTPSRILTYGGDRARSEGFYVGMREGDRVTVWWIDDNERYVFFGDPEGAPLRSCYVTLKNLGWDVSKGSRVIGITGETPAPADTSFTRGHHPQDAANNPEVAAATAVLLRASYRPVRIVGNDVQGSGFMVISGLHGEVRVFTYLDGKLVDMDDDTDDGRAERLLNAYWFELHAAGWAASLRNSHSVTATPPPPAIETAEPSEPLVRYAWQIQTSAHGGEWEDVGDGGVDLSDKGRRAVARHILNTQKLPPVSITRDVRVLVWNLTAPGDPVILYADHPEPGKD